MMCDTEHHDEIKMKGNLFPVLTEGNRDWIIAHCGTNKIYCDPVTLVAIVRL